MSPSILAPLTAVGATLVGGELVRRGGDFLSTLRGVLASDDTNGASTKVDALAKSDSLDSRRELANRLTERFHKLVVGKLRAAGIEPSDGVRLVDNGLGGFEIETNRPDREMINAALTNDPLVTSQFHELRSLFERLTETQSTDDDESRSRRFGLTISTHEAASQYFEDDFFAPTAPY